ncbi:Os02g0745500 [Oryza sativa Japonica Group]|uniref:Os02g0745500 protein n=1 Tax=Oryza sativa subsp. japonica TaxID=39947 RepID=A0A0P0VPS1_ORYSJ|nr:Os02g0745500 [Oryza sativa Japonica Group]
MAPVMWAIRWQEEEAMRRGACRGQWHGGGGEEVGIQDQQATSIRGSAEAAMETSYATGLDVPIASNPGVSEHEAAHPPLANEKERRKSQSGRTLELAVGGGAQASGKRPRDRRSIASPTSSRLVGASHRRGASPPSRWHLQAPRRVALSPRHRISPTMAVSTAAPSPSTASPPPPVVPSSPPPRCRRHLCTLLLPLSIFLTLC